jgi:Ca2+-binding EF-hand superfamily protein
MFEIMDRDRSGQISVDEFWSTIGESNQTMLHQRIFQLLDSSNDGQLDFGEFLQACTTMAMFGPEELSKFVFSIFDPDGNGKITMEEFDELLLVLHSKNQYSFSTAAMFKQVDADDDGIMTYSEFTALVRKFPKFMFPAQALQVKIQSKVMGVAWWDRRFRLFQEAREDLRHGRDPTKDIQKAHEKKRLKDEKRKKAQERRSQRLQRFTDTVLHRRKKYKNEQEEKLQKRKHKHRKGNEPKPKSPKK